jgi:hypothetical protein
LGRQHPAGQRHGSAFVLVAVVPVGCRHLRSLRRGSLWRHSAARGFTLSI